MNAEKICDTIEFLNKKIKILEMEKKYLENHNKKLEENCMMFSRKFPGDSHIDKLAIIDLKNDPIMSEEEQNTLIDWVMKLFTESKTSFNDNGYQRNFTIFWCC